MSDLAFDLAEKYEVMDQMEGDTDSEAFFRCLEKVDNFNGDLLPEVECYSFVAVNFIEKKIFFARDNHRPMCIIDLREELGVRIFCSTFQIVQDSIRYTNRDGLTDIDVDNMKKFFTKTLHGYTVDLSDYEFTNTGRYEDDPEEDESASQVVVEYVRDKVIGFGRRGYPAPATAIGNQPTKKVNHGE
jgi:hypothetical protein